MPTLAKTGNEAMAEAMRQINPDVVAAYPITPATEVVMIFSQFVADGLVDTEYVAAESEHSAMSACVGAASAGCRVMTGTSSQGLQLMSEILPIVSALRQPIVLCEVNRALSGPINIHCDHSDTMAVRDFGWIQIFSENAQEAYDSVLQAVLIAEDEKVRLPAMVTTDGFIISHCMEKIETMEDDAAKKYIGEHKVKNSILNLEKPITLGSLDLQDYYFEHKMPVVEAMKQAKDVIVKVGKEFGQKFGREYGLLEEYKLADAEFAVVALGSTCGTTKAVVDELRNNGLKAGLLKVRVFRPFPGEEIAQALSKVKAAVILDRSDTYCNQGGQLYTEIRSAMYEAAKKPLLANYIYGLGGREISLEGIRQIYKQLQECQSSGQVIHFGVRE
ncbi:pyruvate ferredoxin oxidoreductase [candidate division WOR-1 bacterium RIFCSPLOWO2_02_FULL_46_20]|uniref:Pyruvate ferredoxin oxidoreductase n=2 Tax=Saganbacteria TaxID=1703751 RepID=A0A1F4RH37_UNCSA|nr:MAG: pyruvate ferredoxin oxidoreductase [candidate division WOR-1 bacterium RIFCSPHIGHO2_02_FULL_45_12]OGC06783.1 MAG: pyruvate ferredoxin oxidoreductase [candidate division WOR-1 bacterium RIFCSPLOWO2_02_FULL_46_20]OGC07901.1 MAG: pyruvate ferredoxin oxidoreductase [candidate division WOR-1 bacterium RIFCSPLOWO2_12_FULL_45_9]